MMNRTDLYKLREIHRAYHYKQDDEYYESIKYVNYLWDVIGRRCPNNISSNEVGGSLTNEEQRKLVSLLMKEEGYIAEINSGTFLRYVDFPSSINGQELLNDIVN